MDWDPMEKKTSPIFFTSNLVRYIFSGTVFPSILKQSAIFFSVSP